MLITLTFFIFMLTFNKNKQNKRRIKVIKNKVNFNLDELSRLAQENPEEFERKRKELIEDCIASYPENLKQSLRHQQWKYDAIIQSSKTPLQSCIRMNSLLMDVFYAENGFSDKVSEFVYVMHKFSNTVQKIIKNKGEQKSGKKIPLKIV